MKECSVGGCSRKAICKGLCNAHYLRRCKGVDNASPVRVRKIAKGTICSVGKCGKEVYGRGYCPSHYRLNSRRQRTEILVRYKGDKCLDCGHTFPACVYDFHHREPGDKKFTIGSEIENKSIQEL